MYSLGSSNKQSLDNSKCENHQKLIENEKQSFCKKTLKSRNNGHRAISQHFYFFFISSNNNSAL